MSNALEATQAAFYALGSLAIIVGAVIGVRRFLLERSHDPSWEINWGEAVLRVMPGPPREYLHSFGFLFTNRSLAFQKFEGYWMRISAHDEPDFGGDRFMRTEESIEGFREFFSGEMFSRARLVAPGGSVRFGETMSDARPHSMIWVCYAAVGRRPRLILTGFHKDLVIIGSGSQMVSVGLADLHVANELLTRGDQTGAVGAG